MVTEEIVMLKKIINMEFYKVIGKRGHQGQGRASEVLIYIKANNIIHFQIYN